jgi:hypothetical protein
MEKHWHAETRGLAIGATLLGPHDFLLFLLTRSSSFGWALDFLSFFSGLSWALGRRTAHSLTSASTLRCLIHLSRGNVTQILSYSSWYCASKLLISKRPYRLHLSFFSLSLDSANAHGRPIYDPVHAYNQLRPSIVVKHRERLLCR